MLGLHVADIVVLGLYLLGMAAIGFWSAKKIEQSRDFFMPRRFGKAMMVNTFGPGSGRRAEKLFKRAVRNLVSVALASMHAVLLVDRSGDEAVSCHHNG